MLVAEEQSVTAMSTPVSQLKGVGVKIAERLQKLGIETITDLLLHLPRSYEDHTKLTQFNELLINQHALIEGEIVNFNEVRGRRQSWLCTLSDGKRFINLRFFKVFPQQQRLLSQLGLRLRCYAKVVMLASGIEMVHPQFEVIDAAKPKPLSDTLLPVYAATAGVGQNKLRALMQTAIDAGWLQTLFADLLPKACVTTDSWPSLQEALRVLHNPTCEQKINLDFYRQRLALEELFVYKLFLQQLKARNRQKNASPLKIDATLLQQFKQQLGFELTAAQQRVCSELALDLGQVQPMMRLLQGDVGCGKTCVATIAALHALSQKKQVAFMAPTEILAQQHYIKLQSWLQPLGFKVALLTGQLKASERKQLLTSLASGNLDVLIGTHAIFQKQVVFNALALVLIDEQHRFGVKQRAALTEKCNTGEAPHQLILTATPIPRTLAMSLWSTIDCSVIDEMPANRQPITTALIASARRLEVVSRIAQQCESGRQVYWVCPRIEDDDASHLKSVAQMLNLLQANLPQLTISAIHGQMSANEKTSIMQAFNAHKIDLLVATTVIEVGIDVPNANLIMIEHAERLGLAQLHQLRGRVGRGRAASFCVLLYEAPLSEIAQQRLSVMRDSQDGFKIAEKDLQLRGPGDIAGVAQSGGIDFRCVQFPADSVLLQASPPQNNKVILSAVTASLLFARWGYPAKNAATLQ